MNENKCTRRRFLVMVGTVCAGAACVGCAGALADANTANTSSTVSTSNTSSTSTTSSTSVQTRCPKGMVNDPYPGRCHSYRDTNGNGYCDLSEAEG
jgi:hypothetical protein